MSWTTLTVTVDGTTMDPGIMNCSSTRTAFARAELQEGQPLRYKDPSGIMASLTVLEMDDDGVVLRVDKRERRIDAGRTRTLDNGGRDYTNFELIVALDGEPDSAPAVDLDDDSDYEDDDGRFDAWA